MYVARITEKGTFYFGFNWSEDLPSFQVFMSTCSQEQTLSSPPGPGSGSNLFLCIWTACCTCPRLMRYCRSVIVSGSTIMSEETKDLPYNIVNGLHLSPISDMLWILMNAVGSNWSQDSEVSVATLETKSF